jgi:hypothetical protein
MFTSTVSTSTRPSEISPFNFFGVNAEVGVMAQVSRPFQIALLAVAVLAAVWAVALRGSSKSVIPPAPTSVASTPSSAPTESKSGSGGSAGGHSAGSHSKVYHGAAPGVAGLTRAINKAHEAVATSEQNAKQLEEKSVQASGGTTSGTSAPSATKSTPAAGSKSASASKPAAGSQTAKSTPSKSTQTGLPARQRSIEKALSAGKVVVILFWNPNGADDVAVHHELQLLLKAHQSAGSHGQVAESLVKTFGRELDRKIAVFNAAANQVATFGSITRGVQVNGTPTLLVMNKQGQTTTLTGLQDGYAIEQAINEARHS